MTDHELPLDWVNRELCGPLQTKTLEITQPEPGVIEGQATVYRRKDTSDQFELRVDDQLEGTASVDPSPIERTRVESWRAFTRESVSVDAEPGIGTFDVQFGDESRELTLLKDLPARFSAYHDTPNGDGIVGLDAQNRPTIRIGSETDMFTTVNTFDAIYVDDGFEDRKRVTTKVLPMSSYPGQDIDGGYEFVRQGLVVRNAIPNDTTDSGFVHLFHSPTLGEVRLQADFTGDGYTAYNDPDDGVFAASPIAASPPLWLRLERDGGTFRSYVSTADTAAPPADDQWQLHREETLPNVDPTQDVGLYGTHNNTEQVTATFENFQRLRSSPSTLTEYHTGGADNGLTGTRESGEPRIVVPSGTDIFGSTNEFSALYDADGFGSRKRVTVRIEPSVGYDGGASGYGFARSGVMVRNEIPNGSGDSGYVHCYYEPLNGDVRLQADFDGSGGSTYTPGEFNEGATPPVTPPCWLRLERFGGTFRSYYSDSTAETAPPERDWQPHREETLPNINPTQDVGLYGSHIGGQRFTADFSAFTPLAPSALTEYHTAGATDAMAGVTRDGVRRIVTGRNTDIFGGTNEFSALYRQDGFTDGDSVRVRVLPIEDYPGSGATGYGFARSGVMVRNEIPNGSGDSGYVHLFYTPSIIGESEGQDVRLQADFDGNGGSTYTPGPYDPGATPPVTPPCWLRLDRSGGTFTSYYSDSDAETMPAEGEWTQHREVTLPNVTRTQDVGLYASHNASNRMTARFDAFTVGGGDGA